MKYWIFVHPDDPKAIVVFTISGINVPFNTKPIAEDFEKSHSKWKKLTISDGCDHQTDIASAIQIRETVAKEIVYPLNFSFELANNSVLIRSLLSLLLSRCENSRRKVPT